MIIFGATSVTAGTIDNHIGDEFYPSSLLGAESWYLSKATGTIGTTCVPTKRTMDEDNNNPRYQIEKDRR